MIKTWIFQANPTRFAISEFLLSGIEETEWLVSRYASEIAPGDRVFLWRSASGDPKSAGVVAEAQVVSSARHTTCDLPVHFWNSPQEAQAKLRVRIRLVRVATKRSVLKRDWWVEDPLLRDHLIIKMPNHTTFKVDGDALARLDGLWSNTGTAWSYDELVAALKVYADTKPGPLSKLPGSLIAEAALQIKRPVTGVYNRVLNYRSLDPGDPRQGLDAGGEHCETVWNKFFDQETGLNTVWLNSEYSRLWGLQLPGTEDAREREAVESLSKSLARELSLVELMARLKSRSAAQVPPTSRATSTRSFARDALIGAIARRRANFQCEIPGCTSPSFTDGSGTPYAEVHHILMLADGGLDTCENVACLCPVHHREAHYGARRIELAEQLRAIRDASSD